MKKLMCVWATCVLAACTNVGTAGQGNGDADDKSDGFFYPTLHGRLVFGVVNHASLTRDARFHAWDIALSDSATVVLFTSAEHASLDTVMYLYKKQADGDYGSYIAKSDDYEETVFSEILETLEKGEYRVVIKGYKNHTYGPFVLGSSCTGRGCEGSLPLEIIVPEVTEYTQSCATQLHDILLSPVVSSEEIDVSYGDRVTLPAQEQIAIAHMETREEFDFMVENEEDVDDYELDIVRTVLGQGMLIEIEGPDWTYEYVFGAQGQLVMFVWNEASPESEYFCGLPDEEVDHDIDAECASGMIGFLPHRSNTEWGYDELYSPEMPNDEIGLMEMFIIQRYFEEHGMYEEEVFLDGIHWEALSGYVRGGQTELSSISGPHPAVTYTTSVDESGGFLFFRQEDGYEVRTECVRY